MSESAVEHLAALLTASAAIHGERAALIVKDRTLSYRELDQLATRLAAGLAAEIGVGPGDRVAIQMPNSWEYVVTTFALARLGAIAVPLSVMLTVEEVRNAVDDAGARIVLASRLKGGALATLVGSSAAQRIVVTDDASDASRVTVASLLVGERSLAIPRPPEANDVAAIVYTSATTGKPQGAELTHRALWTNAANVAQLHGRGTEDVTVTALPLPHVFGTVVMNATLLSGGTLVLMKQFSEAETLASVVRHRATMIEGVPATYLHLLNYPPLGTFDLSSLTRCTVGGADILPAKLAELETRLGVPFLELWGMTELAGVVLARALGSARREGSYGQLLPSLELRVVDANDPTKVLPEGAVGELAVRGPTVMHGYHGSPAATAQLKDDAGWLRISTIGRIDADRHVFVLDTKRRLVITAGYKVYPAEVERVIKSHPSVSDARVVGQVDPTRGEVARAFVVVARGALLTEREVLAVCKQKLAAYKVPSTVTFVAALPALDG